MSAVGMIKKQEEEAGLSSKQLVQMIDRVERLEEEKNAISVEIRDVYAEAKSQGFDPVIMRKIVGIRKRDPDELNEQDVILRLYMQALGMLAEE